MNKLTAKGIANAIWHTLSGYYPDNMVELTQFYTYYEVKFFGDAEKDNEQDVIDKVICHDLEEVLLHTTVFNKNGDWCIQIEVNFEREE